MSRQARTSRSTSQATWMDPTSANHILISPVHCTFFSECAFNAINYK